MVLYLKLDQDNHLWLLFCTNIKLKDIKTSHQTIKLRVSSPLMRQDNSIRQVEGVKGKLK